MPPLLALLACILLHITTIALLSIRRGQQLSFKVQQPQRRQLPPIPAWFIKLLGLATALLTLHLPYRFTTTQGLAQCGLRVASFFYACKLFDLSLCRSHDPPILEAKPTGKQLPTIPTTVAEHSTYTRLLLTEMRYHSFNIRATQPRRPNPPPNHKRNLLSSLSPFLPSLLLTLLLPLPALKCLTLLLLIAPSLETLHTLLHPHHPSPVFHSPLSAPSMTAFWTTHWHACASPFLHTLAYRPVRKRIGRGAGVLAAFGLSGVWHGWAAAGLVERELDGTGWGAWEVGARVAGLFVLFGVVCLVERMIWGEREGSWGQRVFIWGTALGAAGECLRALGRYSRLPLLSYGRSSGESVVDG